jgi:D-alanine-D-alanine ligase-like ATP-grasp enzyme
MTSSSDLETTENLTSCEKPSSEDNEEIKEIIKQEETVYEYSSKYNKTNNSNVGNWEECSFRQYNKLETSFQTI